MRASELEALAAGVLGGERRALARALTLVESTRADHREAAERLLERLAGSGTESLRIAISGAPGAGKSTLIETLGRWATGRGHRVAVLTVDPSSTLSGGAILGDKTRMSELARDPRAFIRPSAAGGSHGGVARRTRESIRVCEAAGYDWVLVETVGVGQAETAVAEMTDLFVLVLLPGGGDELQGIKRGIVELADLVVVNKADGELAATAERTALEYRSALRLLRPRTPSWSVEVRACSALTGTGIEAIGETLERYRAALAASGELAARRAEQARRWFRAELAAALLEALRGRAGLASTLEALEAAVAAGSMTPGAAVRAALREAFTEAAGPGKEEGAER